jgi:hypothetical protein
MTRNERKETRFLWKFVILSNGVYEETGFLALACVSPDDILLLKV